MNLALLFFAVLWVVAIVYAVALKNWAILLLPYAVFLFNEVLYAITGFDMIYPADRTALFYDLASFYTEYAGIDPNYSEAYYPDDDYSIDSRTAENAKFAKILEFLGAKTGDTILNVGCGSCSFEKYMAETHPGIKVVGITLSPLQTAHCRKHGIEAYVQDYREFRPDFEGRFDHVIMMGSSEHAYSGSAIRWNSYEMKKENLADIFAIFRRYMKNPETGRLFYSGLHVHPEWYQTWGNLVLERTYGGTMSMDTAELNAAAAGRDAGYTTVYAQDATKEYYMPTVLDDAHFGTPNKLTSAATRGLFALGFVYPPAWWILIYGVFGYWMWMFDGRIHMYANKRYSLKPRGERPCTLWWFVMQGDGVPSPSVRPGSSGIP